MAKAPPATEPDECIGTKIAWKQINQGIVLAAIKSS